MIINYENGRIWHSDCTNHFGGIMKPLTKKEGEDTPLLECLSCAKKGYYPRGKAGKQYVEEVL